jgi:ABC-type multidrug transport system ATPase subunit
LADEPTSGLDSHLAEAVVSQLRALARGDGVGQPQRTVICTVHQPSSDLFRLFDKLLVLADGRVAYFGPAASVGAHFAQLGFPMAPHTNPADHLMAVLVDPGNPAQSATNRKQICDHAASVPDKELSTVGGGGGGAALSLGGASGAGYDVVRSPLLSAVDWAACRSYTVHRVVYRASARR